MIFYELTALLLSLVYGLWELRPSNLKMHLIASHNEPGVYYLKGKRVDSNGKLLDA